MRQTSLNNNEIATYSLVHFDTLDWKLSGRWIHCIQRLSPKRPQRRQNRVEGPKTMGKIAG